MRILIPSVLATIFLIAPARAAEPTLVLLQTIDLKGKAGKLDHVALDAKRGRLLVANKANNTLDIVDLKSGKLLQQVAGQAGIQGLAYVPDLDRIYVGLGVRGFCNIFDAGTYAPIKSIKFADDADNVRYDPRTKLVYVAHADKMLGVIDAKTFALKADIQLPGTAEGFEAEKNGTRLFLNVPDTNEVLVIDTNKHQVIGKYPLTMGTGNHPLALDEANHRVFVGCHKSAMKEAAVVVLDTETGKEVASLPIPDGADDLFFDAQRKRIFVSCSDGFVVTIGQKDADHYEVLEKLPTAKDARTCLLVPEQARLYVAVPRQEGKQGPEIRIFEVK
jgi:DNA-binding beta-propeller fold protein YncE